MWDRKEVRDALQDGSREWITLQACVCANRSVIPLGLIFQAANKALQLSWLEDIKVRKHKVHVVLSSSRWTNNEISLAWLKQVFDRYTKDKARQSYQLLILDSHRSHLTIDFIDYCDQHKILLIVFPPHSTHSL
jgi:hypothetical protein